MSISGIFAMFGFPEDHINDDDGGIGNDFNSYKDSPHFKLGMFKKLIMNGTVFKKQVLKFFSKSDSELDLKEIDEAGEYMMYTRAYYWIQSCKVKNKEWKLALSNYASNELLVAVKLSINYFESTEEYEKCAFLKKIQDFIEKCLAK
jgi:hypothetical protein